MLRTSYAISIKTRFTMKEGPVLAVLELLQTTRYLAWMTNRLGTDSICTLILTVYICAYTVRYFPACIY